MQETIDTLTTSDGETLHTVAWLPDNATPKAIILLAHGIAEHSGRYTHVAKRLVAAGYGVYALDHRGHGKSTGTRTYFENFDHAVDDLKLYFDSIRAKHGDTRYFILGHSMGSLLSLMFTVRYQHELAGMISSGTPLMLDAESPGWFISLGRFLSRYVPKLHLVSLDANDLSHDPAVVSDYKTDPLNSTRPVRIGMAAGLIDNSITVREAIHQFRLPLLIMHGGGDQITPASGSEYLMNHAGSPDKTLHIYPDLYHEIFNEPEGDAILTDLVSWLDAHV